jgi:hypothetical protein
MNLHEEISKVAFELYERSGRIEGRHLENWVEAERMVRERYAFGEKKEDQEMKSCDMPYAVAEKRKHKRFSFKGMQGKFPLSANSKIINISVGGAAVEATKKLEVNKDYSLNIRYKGNPLRLKCRVVWSVLSREEKKESGDVIRIYMGGLKFHKSLLANQLIG